MRIRGLLVLSLAVQGCASPGPQVTQAVRVETPGCEQVSCELGNDLGHWSLARTPGTVTVIPSRQPLTVACRAEHGGLGVSTMPSSMEPTSGSGAVVGGVAGGAAVGAAVGATALSVIPVLGVIAVATGVATGAVAGHALEAGQRAPRYPELVTVPMDCTPRPGPTGGGALGLRVRNPDGGRAPRGRRRPVAGAERRPAGGRAVGRRHVGSCVLLATAGWLGGCAPPPPPFAVEPARFGRGPVDPAHQVPGRVAVVVPNPAAGQTAEDAPRVPIGEIVAQAMPGAAGDALAGGAWRTATVPRGGDGFDATLVVDAIRCTHPVRLLWFVPFPVVGAIGHTEPGVEPELELRLMDGQGRPVWTRSDASVCEVGCTRR